MKTQNLQFREPFLEQHSRHRQSAGQHKVIVAVALLTACTPLLGCNDSDSRGADAASPIDAASPVDAASERDAATEPPLGAAEQNALDLIHEGRQTFRFETFGNEAFFSGGLRLHEVINGETRGGVGPGLDPTTALSLGVRVDVDALPEEVQAAFASGDVDLTSVDTTLDLLRLNAVVGISGTFNEADELTEIGLNCALCHSDVDNSFADGIGTRVDGTPNRSINSGAILALAPDVSPFTTLLGVDEPTVRAVLNSWGPGRFDGHLILDGRAFGPANEIGSVLNPQLSGRAGVNLATYAGWGSMAYWLALVPNIELGGQGTFLDSRLNDGGRFPVAAAARLGQVRSSPDLITPKIASLHLYILSLPNPTPPVGSFDAAAAARGELVFNGQANCASCHVPPLYTEPGWNVHPAADIGIDGFTSSRGPDDVYRTTPLGGLHARQTGGFYHDGRFADLGAVIAHYESVFSLGLSEIQRDDLLQFLLSI